MNHALTYPPASNIVAASILGVSLIASALIVTSKPLGSTGQNATVSSAAKLTVTPPISQQSVAKQFREQLLAAPTVHTFIHKKQKYTLADVKLNQIIYDAKTDVFTLMYEWVWQPRSPFGRPHESYTTLDNDGYGHYYGIVVLSPESSGTGQNTNVTIR